jgi:hypothetical protein
MFPQSFQRSNFASQRTSSEAVSELRVGAISEHVVDATDPSRTPSSQQQSHGSGSKRPALVDISPVNRMRTNSHSSEVNEGHWNEVSPMTSFHNGYYNRSYTPLQIQEHLVRSSVDWRWKQKEGIKLDRALFKTINEDMAKKKSSGKKSDGIDCENLGNLIWLLLDFVFPQRKGKSKAKALVVGISSYLLKEYPEYFHDAMLDANRKFARENVTKAFKIQRTIDTQPTGGLNLSSIDSIRKGVEELPKSKQGMIPSSSTVAIAAKQLEMHAVLEHGFSIEQTDTVHGPVYCFNIHNLIRKVCKAFDLEQYAVTGSRAAPVKMTYTMDGAQLTNDLGHVTGGIKVVDERAIDPLTGIPLAVSGKFQSRDLSFVCQLAFVKDSKQTYKDCFESFLCTFNSGPLVIPSQGNDPELSNFEVSSCQDLSSGWKATTLGGGCHSTNHFCPQCMVSKNTMTTYKSGTDRCNYCQQCNLEKCYCHAVCDISVLEATKKSVKEYIERTFDYDCKRLMSIRKQSKMNFDGGVISDKKLKHHIDYEPNSRREWSEFKGQVHFEIKLA